MRTFRCGPRHAVIILIILLAACAPLKPTAAPQNEVPAGPLVRALEERRESFRSLKAVAALEVDRKGRRLAFDSVGILLKSPDKLRIEAYSPLGTSLFDLIWDGKDVFVRRPGEPTLRKSGSGLERYLGADIGPGELSALLTGNVTAFPDSAESRAFCGQDGCMVEIHQGELVRRVHLAPDSPGGAAVSIASSELYRGSTLVYRARYDRMEPISQYLFPRSVLIENPGNKTGLTVEYEDVELNAAVEDSAFVVSGAEGAGR